MTVLGTWSFALNDIKCSKNKYLYIYFKKSALGIHDALVQKAIYILVPFQSRHIWSTLTINNTLLGKS